MKVVITTNAYEVVGEGNRMRTTAQRSEAGPNLLYEDPNVICVYSMPGRLNPDRSQKKFTLSQDEYPELYAMKRHMNWLRDKASKMQPR